MVLRVAAVDELLDPQWVEIAVKGIPEVELIGRCNDAERAIDLVRTERPDIVLLDIETPSLNGWEILKSISKGEPSPEIILLAGSEQHALRAFEAQAADYILTPMSFERFRASVRKAGQRLIARRAHTSLSEMQALLEQAYSSVDRADKRYNEEIWIRDRNGLTRMPVHTVELFRAEGDYVSARSGATEHLLRDTISTLSERLDPARFARVHRSAIVNLLEVRKVRRRSRRALSLVLNSGEQVAVGPTYTETVLQALGASRWR